MNDIMVQYNRAEKNRLRKYHLLNGKKTISDVREKFQESTEDRSPNTGDQGGGGGKEMEVVGLHCGMKICSTEGQYKLLHFLCKITEECALLQRGGGESRDTLKKPKAVAKSQ